MSVHSPLSNDTKFYIVDWDTNEVLSIHDGPKAAKKDAKARGSKFDTLGRPMPIAFVAADMKDWDYEKNDWSNTCTVRCLFYNPRFS